MTAPLLAATASAPTPELGLAYALIAALVIQRLVYVGADVLNLAAMRGPVPAPFANDVDEAAWLRSRAYVRARTRLDWVASAVDLAALFVFWSLDGFARLDGFVRGLGYGSIVTGLLVLGALGLGSWLVGLPSAYASNFGVEARFGFNTHTRRGWWADTLKSLVLGAVIGGPLLAFVLYAFDALGGYAWLVAWAFVAAWMLGLQFVAPRWILPLFLKFQPLGPGELRARVERLAGNTGFPLGEVSVVDASRRSTKANAFFTGFGAKKRIALFDTLVERHPPTEVEAVLAHEIGHWRHGHIWRGALAGVLQVGGFLTLFGLAAQWPLLTAALGFEAHSSYAALVAFVIMTGPLGLVVGPLFALVSRRHEYQADAFARETLGSPEELVSALVRLSKDSLQNLAPHPVWVALHSSHPPLAARIRALRS